MNNIERKKFSVVITHYRQPDFWRDAVASVLEQDYPTIQIVFSDDGTSGFDPEEVRRFIKARKSGNLVGLEVVTHEENVGTVRNLNDADAYVDGDYILHFAADDALYDASVLSRMAVELDHLREDELGVFGRLIPCDEELQPLVDEEDPWFSDETLKRVGDMTAREQYRELVLADGNKILLGTSAFITGRLRSVLPFDTRNRLNEDYPFSLRVARLGWHMKYIGSPILRYRRGGVSTDRTPSPSRKVFMNDHVRVFEFEILPFMDRYLDPEEQAKVIKAYLDDISYFRLYDKLDEPGCVGNLISYLEAHPETCTHFLETMIVSHHELRMKIDRLEDEADSSRAERDSVFGSLSWKAGRALTFIPRMIRDIIRRS